MPVGVRAGDFRLPGRSLIGSAACAWIDNAAKISGVDRDLPRHELVLSVAVQLALRLLSGRAVEHHPEETGTDFLDARSAVDNLSAIDIHVIFLPFPQR